MDDLFGRLRQSVETNAQHAVELYRREISEYSSVLIDHAAEAEILDFAIFIRRRSIEQAAESLPLDEHDLAAITAAGRLRGDRKLSGESQHHALAVHTALMLREIHEAATPRHVDALLKFVGWIGEQGLRGREAYLQGYFTGVAWSGSSTARLRRLAALLAIDEPVWPDLARQFGLRLSGEYRAVVVRIPNLPALPEPSREEVIKQLLDRWRVPMEWSSPAELIILAPAGGRTAQVGLDVVRDAAKAVGHPCAAGVAPGLVGALTGALGLARRVSEVCPLEAEPTALYSVTDMFVELCVSREQWADDWLREFAERLADGPDLMRTLDVFYRSNMSRTAAAAALCIHTRTLDYRLKRVQEVTGLHPSSTRGVRVLTAAVARARASGWN